MKNKILLSILSLFIGFSGYSQGRIFTSVEADASARGLAMGSTLLGNSRDMYLYTNPSAMVFSSKKLSTTLTSDIYANSDAGRLKQFNFEVAYKLKSSAFFVGSRCQTGLSIPFYNAKKQGKDIHPYEYTIDFGYAFKVIPEIVVYATSSVLNSYMGKKAHGFSMSVGMGYQKELPLGNRSTLLTVGARLCDAGKSVKFANTGLPYSLPTSVVIGGDWTVCFAPKHKLTYALSSRYFTPQDLTLWNIGTGVEYTYDKLLSLRAGYNYIEHSSDAMTMGLGLRYCRLKLDIGYAHTFKKYGVDHLMAGLSFQI